MGSYPGAAGIISFSTAEAAIDVCKLRDVCIKSIGVEALVYGTVVLFVSMRLITEMIVLSW